MRKRKNTCNKQTRRRLPELCQYIGSSLYRKLWPCNLLSAILSIATLLLIMLVLSIACFECFRELGYSGVWEVNVRLFPMGNFLANTTNWLTGWLISIFCTAEDGGLLFHISSNQISLSLEKTSLSLSSAQIVLTTIGTGGVTLSAISEFRARRYLGLSMRDVLHRYYPFHVCFIIMHVLLYILGVYAMERGMIRCSMLTLFGVFLCCIYTVIFSFGAFSAEKLTRAYIAGISRKINKAPSGLFTSLISNIAFYIGKEYSENSRELTDWFKSYSLALVRLLNGDKKHKCPEKQNLSLFNHSPWDEESIFRDAFCISDECCIKNNPEDLVFYRLFKNRKKQQSFMNCFGAKIKTLQIFWRNLFSPFGDDVEGQAEVAAAMLTAAYIHSYSHFIAMVCALSLHKHDINPSKSSSYTSSDFLWQVLKHSQHLQRELCKDTSWILKKHLMPYRFNATQDEWESYRKVLGLTELAVTLWENTLYGRDATNLHSMYNSFLEIADFIHFYDLETSRREIRLYIAYGYTIYLMALPAASLYPSRDYIPSLVCCIEDVFYQKIVSINLGVTYENTENHI